LLYRDCRDTYIGQGEDMAALCPKVFESSCVLADSGIDCITLQRFQQLDGSVFLAWADS